MDPRRLFVDQRLIGMCVYCGGEPETRDHVPSRCLLDEPYPCNLPVVDCCRSCNQRFSLDEQYVACFLDCVISGSTKPENMRRPKVARMLRDNPELAARIEKSRMNSSGAEIAWDPDHGRIRNVILKLARGHAAFELSVDTQIEEPASIACLPLPTLDIDKIEEFARPIGSRLWPENGSRAFIRKCKEPSGEDDWRMVQSGRYQYLVSQADGLLVRMLLSDYLACEVRWG